MRSVVIGGGLAGLAAALRLADAGHDVTRARGAADARRRRADAARARGRPLAAARQRPAHRPRVLHRLAGVPRPRRLGRLARPARARAAGARRAGARRADLRPPARPAPLPAPARCATGSGSSARSRGCAGSSRPSTTTRPSPTVLGCPQRVVERFWDVFIRPALNLRSAEASAALGLFTVQTALLGEKGAGDLLLPTAPLGDDARRRGRRGAAGARGAEVRLGARVVALEPGAAVLADGERVEADAFVVALPPAESARLLERGRSRARELSDRERAPALRPGAAAVPARGAALEPGALGLRPRRAHRAPARARPVPDRRLERRARAARGARARARRADRAAS